MGALVCLVFASAVAALGSGAADAASDRASDITGVVRDPRGRGLKAEIAIDPEQRIFNHATDKQGRFRITDAPAGAVTLAIDVDGYQPKSVQVPSGRPPLVITLEPAATIKIAVVDSRGRPLRAAIRARRDDASERWHYIVEGDTSATAFGLPAGRYRVWADGQPNVPAQVVDVTPPERRSITLRRPPGNTLRLKVVDRDGDPLPDSVVIISGRRPYPADEAAFEALKPQMIESDSSQTFRDLPAGEYTVLVPVPDCDKNVSTAWLVTVSSKARALVTIRLPFAYSECP